MALAQRDGSHVHVFELHACVCYLTCTVLVKEKGSMLNFVMFLLCVPVVLNVVQLLGRVGANPKIVGPEERPFVMFPLATNYTVKTKEENGSGRLSFQTHFSCLARAVNLSTIDQEIFIVKIF